MTDAQTSLDMSTGLRKVAERAKREPAARFNSLAHLIDEELLGRAFRRLRKDAAVGVDDISKDQYAQNLESFASKVRGLLSSTLLRTLAVIAVIVTGLLWFTGRASTAVLVTVIIGIAIVFSADAIVGAIAG